MLQIVQSRPADAAGFVDRLYLKMAASTEPRKTVKFVQFSDAHLDLYYKTGSTVNCGRSYCCRAMSEPETPLPADQKQSAG